MALAIGIVGLPNVGKSTLFRAITNKQVDIQNYPFTTIEPNVGVVEVPDERIDRLAELSESKKKIYATVDFTDIAGLVKGAAQGEGLGNKFLANIRETDAIAHVVRVFESADITHVHNRVDPVDDIEIINLELELAELRKKTIYVLNASEEQLAAGWEPNQRLLDAMKGSPYVIICNKLELELSEMAPEEKKSFLAELGLPESGLDRLIKTAYETLDLISFLTTGDKETRAWTCRRGDTIPHASRAIHTDFERLFIRAEVIEYQKLSDAGSYANARAKGWVRIEGKEYIVHDGDVVEILIGK